MDSIVDQKWPSGSERTPPEERESGDRFDVSYSRTQKELREEMGRMDVEKWNLLTESGSRSEPGVVLRWKKDGVDHAVGCDGYATKKANLRELCLWVEETRMREKRKTVTSQGAFAAAREALPSGNEEATPMGPNGPFGDEEPHEILEVAPDASDETVKAVARRKMADVSPDNDDGGDRQEFIKYQKAKKVMLDD